MQNANIENRLQEWDGIRKSVLQKYIYVEYVTRMGRNVEIRRHKMQTCRICYINGKECGNWVKKKIQTSIICYKNETHYEIWAQERELE